MWKDPKFSIMQWGTDIELELVPEHQFESSFF